MRLILLLLMFLIGGLPVAEAQDGDRRDNRWITRSIWKQRCDEGRCRHYRTEVRVRQPRYDNNERRVSYYGPPRPLRARDQEGYGCRDVRAAVGDQHLTVDGAKKAANDSWAGTIRFHLGEKFMDLSNARHIVYTCSRSSIKEGGVTTLGQSLTRCEIEAQPCHPNPQEDSSQ